MRQRSGCEPAGVARKDNEGHYLNSFIRNLPCTSASRKLNASVIANQQHFHLQPITATVVVQWLHIALFIYYIQY